MKKGMLMVVFLGILLQLNAQVREWVSSTDAVRWQQEKVSNRMKPVQQETVLKILPNQVKQKMMGFGGCFNEMSWDALQKLSSKDRDAFFKEMFSTQGANFSYNRFPVGASDYALDWYSFDETENDFELKDFSIARDRHSLIPYIQRAMQENPQMRFFASPWCPPTWMKTNGNYASLSSEKYNSLDPHLQSLPNTTGFRMLRGYLDTYARYLSKFVSAYREEGISISDFHVQNEVVAEQIFPSCIWEPQDISLFVADYLGPQMKRDHPDLRLWLSTLNVGDPDYMRTALANKEAATFIYGMGFQWAGKESIGTIHQEYPDMHLIQTENECGNGENNWQSALHTWSLIKHYLRSGAEAYTYWNFVLLSPGVSHWGWSQNSMAVIDAKTKKLSYTPEYYLMKHLSHFVMPGALFIHLEGYEDALAFKNPDGSIIVVLANQTDETVPIDLVSNDKHQMVHLKPNSFNTIKL